MYVTLQFTMPKKNTLWNKFDLQNAALAGLHRDDELQVNQDGTFTNDHGKQVAVIPPDGDSHMDASGAAKRSGAEAGLTSNIDNKRSTMDGTAPRVPAESGNTLALKSSASSEGGAGTGETPVDMGMPRELGIFTETRTAILPLKFGVSFNRIGRTAVENTLKIRMNAPYDILGETTFIQQTEGAAAAKGVSAMQADPYNMTTGFNPATFASFETTIALPTAATAATAGAGIPTDASARPAYRLWYERAYQSYHVLETHYRVTFVNPETTPGVRANVFIDKDVYTTSSTGNVMPTTAERFYYNSLFKHVDKLVINERNNVDHGWIKQYSGVWKPGQWSRNTLNDTDIKAWYATGAAPNPAWFENLVFLVTSDEFNSNVFCNLNAIVELRYVVQFKDLAGELKYPISGANITSTAFPTDVLQVPNTVVAWGSSA